MAFPGTPNPGDRWIEGGRLFEFDPGPPPSWELVSGAAGGGQHEHLQVAPATVWAINHDLGQQYVTIQAVNGNTTMIPDVEFVDDDNCTLTFAQARNGRAIIRR